MQTNTTYLHIDVDIRDGPSLHHISEAINRHQPPKLIPRIIHQADHARRIDLRPARRRHGERLLREPTRRVDDPSRPPTHCVIKLPHELLIRPRRRTQHESDQRMDLPQRFVFRARYRRIHGPLTTRLADERA